MITGVDLWQECGEVDFAAVKSSGRTFVTLRCRREWGQLDSKYLHYHEEAVWHELDFFNWHFFNPWHDPERQLREALKYRSDGDLPDAWDVEKKGALKNSTLTDRVCWLLENLGQEIGRRPLLYANYDYLENIFTDKARIMRAADLWLAWPSTALKPRTPNGYPKPLFWQHSWGGVVPGIDRPALLTRWLGTEDEYHRYVGVGTGHAHYLELAEYEQDELVMKALIQLGILDADGFPVV